MSSPVQTGVDDAAPAREEGLSRDVAFEVLSSRRRRHALHFLMQRDDPVDLRELSERISAWENGVEPEEVTYKQRMRVYTALRQSHLPKMDEGGVVEFDKDRGRVAPTDETSELEVYLDVVPHNEIPWSTFYLGLGVLASAVVAAAWLQVFPFGVLPDIAWALATALALLASGVVHTLHNRQMRLGSDGNPPTER